MERVYKIALFVTLIIFGGVVVALLVTPEPREVEKKPVETSSSVKVVQLDGKTADIRSVAILCVEGHAFLKVTDSVPYAGTGNIARFPEMDGRCK